MKFQCGKCGEHMGYESSTNPVEGSVRITFVCPKCGNRVSMITNPSETQLVHSLGVSIGGRTLKHQPLELTRATLKHKRENESEFTWTEEAKKRLDQVPIFVRSMAKKAIENYAQEQGYKEINPDVIDKARKEMGM